MSATFYDSLCKWALCTCNARFASVGGAISVEAFQYISFSGGVSVYFMPGSIQRGAFFMTVEIHKEAVSVVSRSLRVALSSHRTESS